MKKALLAFLVVSVSVLTTIFLSQRYEYFPAKLNITYHSANTENLTIYFDVGRGFQQDSRWFGALEKLDDNKVSVVSVPLPVMQLNRIRIDLDSSSNQSQSIAIESLCVKHKGKENCWSAKELSNTFIALNAIKSHALTSNSATVTPVLNPVLSIQTQGADPHFSFDIPIRAAQKDLAEITSFQYVLFAVLLMIILFYLQKLLRLLIFPWAKHRFLAQKQHNFSLSLGVASAGLALLSIMLSGAWLIVFQAGLPAIVLSIGGIIMLAMLPSKQTASLQTIVDNCLQGLSSDLKYQKKRQNIVSIFLVSAFALLPLLTVFASTWVQEFPHLGDHEYHLWGNRVSYQAIEHNDLILFLSLLSVIGAYFLGCLRWAVIVIAIALVLTGLWNALPANQLSDVQGIFSRYPGGARILAHPFVHLSFEYQWNDPLNTGRMLNVLSVPVWLLILRPLIIGRLPSWESLAVIAIFFWQAEIVYQFSTAYLDVWSVIFILLATEKLIVSQTDQERLDGNGYLKACLLLGIACAFKEPAVFIIPWFWFAGWSLGIFRGQARQVLIKRFYHACIVGFASVLPFLVYYAVRKSFGVSRYTVKGFEYFLSGEWFAEMANRIGFHFGWLGSTVLILVALLWLVVLLVPIWRKQRWMMLCILGALLSQVFLFNWDQGGVAFTGYFRFYLPALVLFFAPVMLIASSRKQLGHLFPKVVLIMAGTAFIGNTPTMYAAMKTLDEPDSARNFNEHYDAPIYLPIRSLIKTAEEDGVLEGDRRAIYINHVTSWNQPAFVYSDLLRKYKLHMNEEINCGCSPQTPTVLIPFVHITGLNDRIKDKTIDEIRNIPQHQPRYVERWREVSDSQGMCLAEIERTCQYSTQEKLKDGTIIGAIGVGLK